MVRLIQERPGIPGSRVVGAIIRRSGGASDSPDDANAAVEYYHVNAKSVILATGGFQGSPRLTSSHLGPGGGSIFIRSNRGSVGDGLDLAVSVGAGLSRGLDTYYGHLLPAPLRVDQADPRDYLGLAQYRVFPSPFCSPFSWLSHPDADLRGE